MFKFKPIFKSTLWGGEKIAAFKHLDIAQHQVGESWEISGIPGKETVVFREKPVNGRQTFVLEKGKTYEFTVGNPKNGWWQLWFGSVDENDEQKWVDDEAWMPASALYMIVTDWGGASTVPVYAKPDEKSRKLFDLKTGTLVHPTDLSEWSWVKVQVDGHPEQTGWIGNGKLTR